MKSLGTGIAACFLSVLFVFIFTGGCQYERPSLWEMKCGSCHDGKTVLNGKVVTGQQEMKSRYKDMETFVNICKDTPGCMNILKHDKDLFREVGREIGIGRPSG